MPALDAIAGWLLAVSWQLLPLTAIVIALDFALRRAGPVVRSALWWMVLAKLIVPPGLASPLSIAQFLPVDAASAIVAATNLASIAMPVGPSSRSPAMTNTTAPEARSGWQDLVLSSKSNRVSGAAMMHSDAAAARRECKHLVLPGKFYRASGAPMMDSAVAEAGSDWQDLILPCKPNRDSGAAALVASWASGAIAAAVLACWRYRRGRASCLEGAVLLTDAARDVHDDVVVAAARRLDMSTSALPQIFIAAGGAGAAHAGPAAHVAGLPAVIGFFKPCIVLPPALLARPHGEIEHVLLHELAHVRRRDPLTSLVCLAAQIVFWFHPAIWCARWRLATLREMACDRTVARLLGDATPAYRRTLILLARSSALATTGAASTRCAAGPGALGLFQRQSQLVTRLEALARPISMRRATERAAGAAIALAILVSCVPLASSRAAPTTSIDVPPLDLLPGSLQKRYAVMRALALEEQAQPPQPSR